MTGRELRAQVYVTLRKEGLPCNDTEAFNLLSNWAARYAPGICGGFLQLKPEQILPGKPQIGAEVETL